MDIRSTVNPELERELLARAPWMHPYRLAPEVIVGTFKHHLSETVCVSTSPPELIARMQTAYAAHLAGGPGWQARTLGARLGGLGGLTVLDIACATGLHSFEFADAGAAEVVGVEIRPEQVAQAELIRTIDEDGRFARVRFEHEPVSADDPGFRAGESYDIVLSMGVLYHLTNPLQHLRNLHRLSRRVVLLHTLTHQRERGYWLFVREDPAGITKAAEGVSWIPHFADLPELLMAEGFERVEVVASPELEQLQAWDRRNGRLARLTLPGAVYGAVERVRSRRYLRRFREAARRDVHARYYTYLAWKDAS